MQHERLRCAIVHPCDAASLRGALDAARHGLFTPVIVAPVKRLLAVATEAELDLGSTELIDAAHSHDAAERAATLAAQGDVQALMKGSLHTDELISAVLARPELRTKRRLSHVFRFDVPAYHKPLLVTVAAINVSPTLEEKAHIVQNAIDLARVLGCEQPKVAVLAAVESVNSKMLCTLDAAALSKMAERGQITCGIVGGPLAFDNAISAEAARIKGIVSPVAGDPDILMVPDLVSGNILAKQLEYLGGAMGSGVVLGARVPIALTSRAVQLRTFGFPHQAGGSGFRRFCADRPNAVTLEVCCRTMLGSSRIFPLVSVWVLPQLSDRPRCGQQQGAADHREHLVDDFRRPPRRCRNRSQAGTRQTRVRQRAAGRTRLALRHAVRNRPE